MLWIDPQTLPLTWVEIASKVPSESGVYAIMDDGECVLVGESWNLKARLLDMIKVVDGIGEFSAVIDLCPEKNRMERKEQLAAALLPKKPKAMSASATGLPGISFWQA